jgi:hypothetical protein
MFLLKVLECIHSVVEPKYFYEPLLLIFWINPELLPWPRGFSPQRFCPYVYMYVSGISLVGINSRQPKDT